MTTRYGAAVAPRAMPLQLPGDSFTIDGRQAKTLLFSCQDDFRPAEHPGHEAFVASAWLRQVAGLCQVAKQTKTIGALASERRTVDSWLETDNSVNASLSLYGVKSINSLDVRHDNESKIPPALDC
ncbi:hypothetical protein PV04_07080 [Phialophora macrospora]|uniref:Uncharacterized protein n=1 Tax=Phialophora macrospora TaxID=1851006 RepID=A0A0D2E0H3_9EURO|nr:hypothetical protein PV04_07080 [Phialophora macrospora]